MMKNHDVALKASVWYCSMADPDSVRLLAEDFVDYFLFILVQVLITCSSGFLL